MSEETTMIATLVAFLLERLDEDEHFADRAGGREWSWGASEFIPNFDPEFFRGVFATNPPDEGIAMSPEGPGDFSWTESRGAHIARHDPARVLAEVNARRAIVAEHSPPPPPKDGQPGWVGCFTCIVSVSEPEPCLTLRLLAQPYAEHPEYQDKWRP